MLVTGLCLGPCGAGWKTGSVDEAATLKAQVWRSQTQGFQEFDVPRHDSQTVLDVVSWIQAYADPTLTYRFACRVGVCGSCAMMVNGVPRWTCRTHVEKVSKGPVIKIAPLRNLPVIKDLAADLDPFFDKWIAAGGRHHPTASRREEIAAIAPDDEMRTAADSGIECINCAVCYAACDTVAGISDYFGPAALQRAWTLLNDARDGARDEILNAATGSTGCYNCHSIGSCTAHCPSELDPLAAIAGLKRAGVRKAMGR